MAEAVDWLAQRLFGGAVPTREMLRDARDAGISPRTLDRARARLGVTGRPMRGLNSGRLAWLAPEQLTWEGAWGGQ